jgi:hypothetical protein
MNEDIVPSDHLPRVDEAMNEGIAYYDDLPTSNQPINEGIRKQERNSGGGQGGFGPGPVIKVFVIEVRPDQIDQGKIDSQMDGQRTDAADGVFEKLDGRWGFPAVEEPQERGQVMAAPELQKISKGFEHDG